MYNGLINLLNKWGIDIRTLKMKHYDNKIEILVNGHYIYTIEKTN